MGKRPQPKSRRIIPKPKHRLQTITVDFETEPFQSRPEYPPKPVGVSIKYRGKAARYYAFGHPTKNNCTEAEAKSALRAAYDSKRPLVFHNANFDTDVAETHWKLKMPEWQRVHDTLYLLFLDDPYARSLSLKPSAERLLNWKADERNRLHEWLKDNGFIKNVDQKNAGEFYCKAPGDIVGEYANGDTDRTEALFDLLYDRTLEAEMGGAYDTERELMPILLENERDGMRVDLPRLKRDIQRFEAAQAKSDAWLRKRLKAPDLNVDSDAELAEALDAAGVVTQWVTTKTGKRSTAKKNMTIDMFGDKRVAGVLAYRNRLQTCLSIFMRPWYETAAKSGGRIFTHWNQVRQSHGDEGTVGARTGRMSCSPNFQNVPKDWYDKADGWTPELFAVVRKLLNVPELPLMRQYILPEKGHEFGHRDYNQQEPRILAHFEDDKLCAQYNEDPTTDFHNFARDLIRDVTGDEYERRYVKQVNLALIYAMGNGSLALKLGVDIKKAKQIRDAHRKALPGLAELEREVKARGLAKKPIRTWGGRLYYCEPPKLVNKPGAWNHGRMQTFEYKLPNYLIQGSAADCTKRAIIAYAKTNPKKRGARFLVTVHDECNISAPKSKIKQEMLILRDCMENVRNAAGQGFGVPMRTDAKKGPCWAAAKSFKEAERGGVRGRRAA